ncbi:MAG: hypothetical protein WCI55_05885 [Armatimonadota bacterium]
MKRFPIWAISSGVLGGIIISLSQSELSGPLKHVVAGIGGGFFGLAIIVGQKHAKVKMWEALPSSTLPSES